MKLKLYTFLLCVLIAYTIQTVNAQSEIAVTWHVTDKTGKPLPNVQVTVINESGNETLASGVTDQNGDFTAYLPPAPYLVVIKYGEIEKRDYYYPTTKIRYTVILNYVPQPSLWLEYREYLPYAAIGLITVIFIASTVKVSLEKRKPRSKRKRNPKPRKKASKLKELWRKVS